MKDLTDNDGPVVNTLITLRSFLKGKVRQNSQVGTICFDMLPPEVVIHVIGYCPDNGTLEALLKASQKAKALWINNEHLRHLCTQRIILNSYRGIIKEPPTTTQLGGAALTIVPFDAERDWEAEISLQAKKFYDQLNVNCESLMSFDELRQARIAFSRARDLVRIGWHRDQSMTVEQWLATKQYLWWPDGGESDQGSEEHEERKNSVIWYTSAPIWENLLVGLDDGTEN